jgi:hypothetical protein
MHGHEKSDPAVVAGKLPNKAAGAAAEASVTEATDAPIAYPSTGHQVAAYNYLNQVAHLSGHIFRYEQLTLTSSGEVAVIRISPTSAASTGAARHP